MKKKIRILSAALVIVAFAITACGSGNYSKSQGSDYNYDETAAYEQAGGLAKEEPAGEYPANEYEKSGEVEATTEVNPAASGEYKQKLIKTVDLNIATKEYDKSVTDLNNYIKKNNSYVEYSNTYNPQSNNSYEKNTRSATYTIRVPEDKLDTLVVDLETVGTVTSKTENVRDVSLEYSDIESHKKALEAEEESLLNLLANAQSVEAIIALQSRLSEIRYEKESYESSLRLYDNQVQYSTVSLSLNEVKEYDTISEETYWGKFQKSFASSMAGSVYFFGELLIFIFACLPYLVPLALIIALICFVIIKLSNKGKARKEKIYKQKSENSKTGDGKAADKESESKTGENTLIKEQKQEESKKEN